MVEIVYTGHKHYDMIKSIHSSCHLKSKTQSILLRNLVLKLYRPSLKYNLTHPTFFAQNSFFPEQWIIVSTLVSWSIAFAHHCFAVPHLTKKLQPTFELNYFKLKYSFCNLLFTVLIFSFIWFIYCVIRIIFRYEYYYYYIMYLCVYSAQTKVFK